jgi:hypothetical protein
MVATLGLCLYGLFWWYWRTLGFFPRQRADAKAQSIEALVRQNIHAGDSLETVDRFLDAEHFGHSLLGKDQVLTAGHAYPEDTIVASTGVIEANSMVTETLQIIFVFDDHQRLIRVDFYPYFTGP